MAVQTTLLTGNRNVTREILDQEILYKAYIDTTVTPLTSGDYYRLFGYDANTLIRRAQIIVGTVEGAAETCDLTDNESGTTTLISNNDMNTLGAGTAYAAGLFKTAAGYVSLKPDAALTATKFWVLVSFIRVTVKD